MPDQSALKSLTQSIDDLAPNFTSISDQIWDLAELKYDEYKSAKLLVETLKQHGFSVEEGIAEWKPHLSANTGMENLSSHSLANMMLLQA